MKRFALGFAAALLWAAPALAHTAWLTPVPGQAGVYRVEFGGHAGKLEPYDAAKVKTVQALDAAGAALPVSRTLAPDGGVMLTVAGAPALIAMHFDNGIHTRTAAGGPSIPRPMSEVSGAVSAVNALKHHKTIVAWSSVVTRPLGQAMEVVPQDAAQPQAGQPMRVRVLIDGRPAAGVRLGHGEEGEAGQTDTDGYALFTPVKGPNKLWAGRRTAVVGNPAYTQLSYEYLLGFDAR
jgi:nickel transport protein